VHYCVTNMPGAVPHTSTVALSNATLPYLVAIAAHGLAAAATADPALKAGVNVLGGEVVHPAVKAALEQDGGPRRSPVGVTPVESNGERGDGARPELTATLGSRPPGTPPR